MSLDVDLMLVKPVSVYEANITHNLAKMADEVKIPYMAGTVTLYTILWRPEELQFTKAREIADLLDEGWNILLSDPEYYSKFNPENGWEAMMVCVTLCISIVMHAGIHQKQNYGYHDENIRRK